MPPKKKARALPPLPRRILAAHLATLPRGASSGPDALTSSDLLAVLGLQRVDVEGKQACRYAWPDNEGPSTDVGKRAKGKAKAMSGCDEGRCGEDPRCLNWLGQARWKDDEAALKAFRKALGLTRNPANEDRDPDLPIGLRNLAATCYMNALLQVWYQDLPLRSAVYSCTLADDGQVEVSPLYQLQAAFTALQTSAKKVYDPEPLVKSLKLDTQTQQDAQEFSKLFMSRIDQEFKRQADTRVQGLVAEQFEGRLKYGTECLTCHHKSERESAFLELEVNLAKRCTLEQQVRAMLESEILDGDNKYRCGNCDELRDARRYTELVSFPPVLHFSLLRFTFDLETLERKKSTHSVEFPFTIDMNQFICDDAVRQPALYDLKGVLLHKGGSAHHGHYMAEVFDVKRQRWYHLDDESVSPLAEFNGPEIIEIDCDPSSSSVVKPKKSSAKTKQKKKEAEKPPPGRTKTSDAYMLIYTHRDHAPSVQQAGQEIKPPLLAVSEIDRQNAEHEQTKTAWKVLSESCEDEFKKAKETKLQAWRSLPPEPEQTFVLASANQLRRWMTDELEKKGGPGRAEPEIVAKDAPVLLRPPEPRQPEQDTATSADAVQPNGSFGPETGAAQRNGHPRDPETKINGTQTSPRNDDATDGLEDQGLSLRCEHGRLDPQKASSLKAISEVSASTIRRSANPAVDFYSLDDACRTCAWSMIAEERYAQEHERHLADFGEGLRSGSVGTYWISKAWLADWCSPSPSMHLHGSVTDPAPNADHWARDVTCLHGSLQPMIKLRRTINAEAAAVLQTVFPAWTTLDDSSRPCSICVTEHEERETIKGDLHQVARAEKSKLKGLVSTAGKRLFPPDGIDGFLVPPEWIRRWSDWTRDPIKYDRPDAIDNRRYICEHNLLVVDLANEEDTLDSGRVGAVMMHEWDAIKKLYPASGPELRFVPGEPVPSALQVCQDCRAAHRKAFERAHITVRVLDPRMYEPPRPGQPPTRKRSGTSPPRSTGGDSSEDDVVGPGRKRKTAPITYGNGARKSRRIQQRGLRRGTKKDVRLEIEKGEDVKSIKLKLQERTSCPPIYQRLYFEGRELDSSDTVEGLGIGVGDVLEMLGEDIDDELFDLTNLTDADAGPRGGRRAEGFAGSGLVGFETFTTGSSSASEAANAEEPVDVDPESSTSSGHGTTCPMCTLLNASDAEACDACGHAFGV